MAIDIEPCLSVELRELHRAMNGAFSDYLVPMSLTFEQFRFMLKQRGFDADLSWIAKADGIIVSFWLVATQPEAHPNAAYVIAAGTLPAFRGRNLSGKVFRSTQARLVARGISVLRLEVIENNPAARRLYDKLGFAAARKLVCYSLKATAAPHALSGFHGLRRFDLFEHRDQIGALQDWPPTWQNGLGSLARIAESVIALGAFQNGQCLGYGALIEPSAAIAQLAVKPEHRRKGLGSAILAALAHQRSDLEILNVDHSDERSMSFFEIQGAEPQTFQVEMTRPIADRL